MSSAIQEASNDGPPPRGLLSTVLIALFLGAFAGFLWIGRGRAAVAILAIWLLAILIGAWRLYAGDAWIAWLGPLASNELLTWLAGGLLALLLVLPFRRSSRPGRWYARGWRFALLMVGTALAGGLLALAIRSFVVQPFLAPSASMAPTLEAGDHFFADKRAYGYRPYSLPFGPWPWLNAFPKTPRSGEIVVFQAHGTPWVKRVIGLPGDRVQVVEGTLRLNGAPVPAEEVASDTAPDGLTSVLLRETLPDDVSYLTRSDLPNSLGDNTREFVVPAGHLFVMGDNRDNSADSRFDLGFVPMENLIGRAHRIFWNAEGAAYRDRADLLPGSR